MVPAKATAQPDRILDAALACVARVGVAKTTLDDVARAAGCARATVYRCFPGRDALLAAVLEREVARVSDQVLAAAARAETLADAVVAVVLAAGEPFRSHAALGFVLAHEPEIVTAQLSFERGSEMLETAAALAAPAFTRFLPADRAARLAEWVARLTLSYLCNPSEQIRLDDPRYVRALVVDYVLPGFTRNTNPLATTPAAGGSL